LVPLELLDRQLAAAAQEAPLLLGLLPVLLAVLAGREGLLHPAADRSLDPVALPGRELLVILQAEAQRARLEYPQEAAAVILFIVLV
jgi:hypothetical protein